MNVSYFSDIRVKPLFCSHFHIVTHDFLFQIKEDKNDFFAHLNKKNGGINGLIIGVSDFEKSKEFYSKVFGYDTVIYEGKGKFEDFEAIDGGNATFKRIVLQQSNSQNSKFSNFFGKNELELIKVIDRDNYKIIDKNVVNPYRFGYFSADNRDIIGNYTELGYEYDKSGNEEYIEITDPDGVVISCNQSIIQKKANFFNDLSIFAKFFKQKL